MEERPWQELGGDYFVRQLQEFVRASDRRVAELSFEKVQMEARIAQLEAVVANKDRIIKEYLRRVALLEFSLRKSAPSKPTRAFADLPDPIVPAPPARGPSAKELIKKYLDELGDLVMPVVDTTVDDFVPLAESDRSESEDESIGSFALAGTLGASLGRCGAVGLANLRGSACIIAGGDEGVVKLWTDDSAVGGNSVTPHLALRYHRTAVTGIAVEAGSSSFASGDESGEIAVWTVNDTPGKLEMYPSSVDVGKCFSVRSSALHSGPVASLAMRGEATMSAGSDMRIVFNGLESSVVSEFASKPTAVLWTDRAVSAFTDGSVCVLDPETGKSVFTDQFGASITAIDSFENVLAMAQSDGTILLLDLVSNTVIERIVDPRAVPVALACSAPRLATGNADGSVCIRDVRKLAPAPQQTVHAREAVSGLTFAADGRVLACASTAGKVHIFHRKI